MTPVTTSLAGQTHARPAKASSHAQSAAPPTGQQRQTLASPADAHADRSEAVGT